MIDRLADRSLSAALASAQNRAEQAQAGGYADELTIDRDISVIWGPRVNLHAWLAHPIGRPGDTPPTRAGQWLYKIFLGSDGKPLYLGRVTGSNTSLLRRIRQHIGRGTPIAGLTAAGVRALIANNKAMLRAGNPGARSESRLIDDILASLGPAAFQISFSEIKRLARGGKRTRAFGADTALAEKHYHRKRAARITSRDNPRFEEETRRQRPAGIDPLLARLVDRVAAGLGAVARQ